MSKDVKAALLSRFNDEDKKVGAMPIGGVVMVQIVLIKAEPKILKPLWWNQLITSFLGVQVPIYGK